MYYEDFGKIVASLREDLGLTQPQLADLAGIPFHVLSHIERGKKSNLSPDILVALADVLQLTTCERRQFILAASGLGMQDMVRPDLPHTASDTADPKKELEKLQNVANLLQVPAFVIDPFYDFVMVNRPMLSLFKVTQPLIDYLASVPRGFNSIHLTFGKGLFAQAQMDWNWDEYAFNTMRGFRENSLRYRHHPYFQYLMRCFRNPEEYPFFERFWRMAASTQEDKEANWDFLEYHGRGQGHLHYMADTTIFTTAFGDLYFIKYFPLNPNTDKVFSELAAEHGTQMLRFASWPEKTYPQADPPSNPRKR